MKGAMVIFHIIEFEFLAQLDESEKVARSDELEKKLSFPVVLRPWPE
jgi:hypothetical protein